MKKCNLLILIIALLIAVACFASCGGSTESTDGQTSSEPATSTPATSEPPVTTLPALESFESVKIAGNDLKDYTIVYAESPLAGEAAKHPELLPVYDFDKESADRLSDIIFARYGVRLAVKMDTATEVSDKEILIGETNRELVSTISLKKVKAEQYLITLSDAKLVVCGGTYGTTWHALDYVEAMLDTALKERKGDFEFAADYRYEGTYHLVRIGCIGDSITQGVGIKSSATMYAYPVQLGRFLWKDALVTNFGLSGKTMRNDLADAYTKTTTYTRALASASGMDMFTIMLGTNDSNRDRNWNANSTQQYKESCRLLLENLTKKNKDLSFVLANCPAYFGSDDFGSRTVRDLQKSLVKEMNDLGYPTTFFDMHKVTVELRDTFEDKLHPNEYGHVEMARAFAEALEAIIHSEQ